MTWFTDMVEELHPNFGAVAEVSAGTPDRTQFAKYCDNGRRVLLVEPGPGFDMLMNKWGHFNNVTLRKVAIDDKLSEVELWFLPDERKHHHNGHVTADYPHHAPYAKDWYSIKVPAVPFSDIDPGDIDAMTLDVEGSEMKVLNTMVSRPEIICVEIRHADGRHPAGNRIADWMKKNGYSFVRSYKLDDVYMR